MQQFNILSLTTHNVNYIYSSIFVFVCECTLLDLLFVSQNNNIQ